MIKAFAKDAPLQCKILDIVERTRFVDRPAHGAMVDHDIMVIARIGIERIIDDAIGIAETETNITEDNVAAFDGSCILTDTDTVARRRLPGNGEAVFLDLQCAVEINRSRYLEYDGAVTLANGIAQATGAGVVEVGHFIHRTIPASYRQSPKTFRAGECRLAVEGNRRLGKAAHCFAYRVDTCRKMSDIAFVKTCGRSIQPDFNRRGSH